MDYMKSECEVCGKVFVGEDSKILAERCAENHERIFISMFDYELGNFINWVNTHGTHGKLPKGFMKKLKQLNGRVLRG